MSACAFLQRAGAGARGGGRGVVNKFGDFFFGRANLSSTFREILKSADCLEKELVRYQSNKTKTIKI